MWKDIAERGRSQKIIWRMRISCCIPKATNTHTGCVILITFLLPHWLYERTATLGYAYIACLVLFFFFLLWTDKLSKSRSPCQISSTKYLNDADSPIKQKALWYKADTVSTSVRVLEVFGTQDAGQNHQQKLITVWIRKYFMARILENAEILMRYSNFRGLLPITKYAPDFLWSIPKQWPYKRFTLFHTIFNRFSILASMIPILYHMKIGLFSWYEQPQSLSFYRNFVSGQCYEQ